MAIQANLKTIRWMGRKNKQLIFSTFFLGIIIILPTFLILDGFLIDSKKASPFLATSAIQNYSGVYDGNISTMGVKANLGYDKWTNTTQVDIEIPSNISYYGLEYSLNRLDILTLNIYNGSGTFSIAENVSGIPVELYNESSILGQEFTTPESPDLLSIDTINLYIKHESFGFMSAYYYFVLIYNENFTEIMGSNTSVRITFGTYNNWIVV